MGRTAKYFVRFVSVLFVSTLPPMGKDRGSPWVSDGRANVRNYGLLNVPAVRKEPGLWFHAKIAGTTNIFS